MEEYIDELWTILNSDESETNRISQAKDLLAEWAEENDHDLPEIQEFDLGDDEDDDLDDEY